MPASSTPSSDLLKLGAGELFFQRHDASGNPVSGFIHMGNVETLELTLNDDILIKRSSMSKGRPIYRKVTRSREVVLRAVADEFSPENLALALMGSLVYAAQAATPVADKVLYADVPAASLGAALGGQYFHLGALNVGTVSLSLGATALDEDDWVMHNAAMGVVRILPTSVVVTNGTNDLTASFTPALISGAVSPVVRGGTETEIHGSVLFIEDNGVGTNHIFRAWRVSTTPDGALGLISEDFAQFALNMTIEDDSIGRYGGTTDDPLFHLQEVPAATV